MADKRISQLIERVDIANNDVLPIVASGATTTNKVTISTIQDWMQGNLDLGVTSVGITIGTSGTDVNVTGSPITTSGNITINIPTASASNRGLLSAADWSTFNAKQPAGNYVTLDTTQTITAHKTFTASGGQNSITINHSSGAGHALDITKAGNGEGIRVNKTSGSGNAATIIGTLEATTIVKTGGTSSQFLKADGSVDSSTYVNTDTNQSITGIKSFANGFNLASAGGTNQTTTFKNIGTLHEGTASINQIGFNSGNNIFFGKGLNNGGVISWNNEAVRYYALPDSDGTIALTSQIPANIVTGTGGQGRIAYWDSTGVIKSDSVFQYNDFSKRVGIGRTPLVPLDVEGAGAFSGDLSVGGALNGTSASFSGDVSTVKSGTALVRVHSNTTSSPIADIELMRGTNTTFGSDAFGDYRLRNSLGDFTIQYGDSGIISTRLTISSSGAATFSSSVTAGTFLRASSGAQSNPTGGASVAIDYQSTSDIQGRIRSRDWDGGVWKNLTIEANNILLSPTGNVGIGTASPGQKLVVQESGDCFIQVRNNTAGQNLFLGALNGEARINNDNSTPLTMWVNGSERMRITSGGYLKASPAGSYTYGTNTFHSFENNISDWTAAIVNNSVSNNYGLLIQYPNNSPNNGDNFFIACVDINDQRFRVASNGNVTNTNGSYGSISDIKLKENIEDATPKLDDLMKVKVRNYNLIGDDKKQIGVIAQELEEVFPTMIDESEDFEELEVPQVDEEGNEVLNEEGEVVTEKQRVSKGTSTKSVKYSVFVPMLIKAMQEQQEQIKSLTEQVEALKSQING